MWQSCSLEDSISSQFIFKEILNSWRRWRCNCLRLRLTCAPITSCMLLSTYHRTSGRCRPWTCHRHRNCLRTCGPWVCWQTKSSWIPVIASPDQWLLQLHKQIFLSYQQFSYSLVGTTLQLMPQIQSTKSVRNGQPLEGWRAKNVYQPHQSLIICISVRIQVSNNRLSTTLQPRPNSGCRLWSFRRLQRLDVPSTARHKGLKLRWLAIPDRHSIIRRIRHGSMMRMLQEGAPLPWR